MRPYQAGLSVAGVAIPFLDETKHFKFIGTTGTGKSTAIRELLGGANSSRRSRRDRRS
jgi:GTP-binding protein EngB required for normal cell division